MYSLTMGKGLTFPYYSSVGPIDGKPTAASAKVEVVMIAQHGAGRNGDDYFCAGCEAARMQKSVDPSAVAVISPTFMELPDFNGNPSNGTLWWNGSFVQGYWRAGGDSDPAADPSGAGNVYSSFAVYDQILSLIMDRVNGIFPNIKRVSIAGHSSGGQIVQRHAHFTRVRPSSPSSSANTVTLRHVASNPSSFAYLDPRRWLPSNATGPVWPLLPRHLGEPPFGADEDNCTEYNAWYIMQSVDRCGMQSVDR
jgi:hypothetical protein